MFARGPDGNTVTLIGAETTAASPLKEADPVQARKLLVAKPAGLAAGSIGGVAFRTLWRKLDRGRDVPEPTDDSRPWRTVLMAAALQGAIFAVLHAVVERVTAPRKQNDGAAH